LNLAEIIFACFLLLVLLVWIERRLYLRKTGRESPEIKAAAGPLDDPPLVSIIIAAKDEEDNIEGCIKSVLKQDYPNFEIIVVDDRSQDRTPEILRRLCETEPRFSVIRIDELPPGWTGKNHALHQGTRAARGEWFLFLDADSRISRSNLASALNYASSHKVDMLSLIPLLRNDTFWEKVLMPYLSGTLFFYLSPAKVNAPNDKSALSIGQYVLFRRSAYESIGGHESIKGVLLEDFAVAKRVKEKGFNMHLAFGRKVLSNRMYESFQAIWQGWVRIFYMSFVQRQRDFMTSLFVIPLLILFPTVSPIIALARLLSSPGLWAWGILALAILVNIALVETMRKFYQVSSGEGRWAIFHPLAGIITLGVVLVACFKILFRRPISWRGTTYSVGNRGG